MLLTPLTGIPFIIVSILHIILLRKNNQLGRNITKPLLMPLLLLFYIWNVDNFNSLIIWALIASFFGDVFLIWSEQKLFLLGGIASFLIGHIFYVIAFLSFHFPLWFYLLLVPYIVIGAVISSKLFPSINKSMKLPVGMYMVVILLMSFFSLTRIWSESFIPFLLPFLGSLFFITSDSILAFDMFTEKKRTTHTSIMVTYILAQFLIVLGFMI
jgi:uncharacterized membrane protein YhhN